MTRVAGTCRLDHSAAEAGRVVNRAAEAEVTRVAGTCRLDHSAAEAGRVVNRAAEAEVTRVAGTCQLRGQRARARPAARGASCLPAAEPSDGIDTRRPPLTSDHDGGGQRASTPVSSVSSDMGANERRHAPLIRRQAATRPAGRPSSGRH